ncbi:MAG: DUF2141 domain-containing protein [Pseudomonadota bacterium]
MPIYKSTSAATLSLILLFQASALAAQDAVPSLPDVENGSATVSLVSATTTLEITFAQIADPTGQIMLAMFDSKEAYESGVAPVKAIAVPVTGEAATVRIPDLRHGRYGFKIVHDLNGDGAMNTNPFGMPIEPFAFSNNAVANMGPASWEAAAFDVAGPTQQIIKFR